jgi:hypothetical protein
VESAAGEGDGEVVFLLASYSPEKAKTKAGSAETRFFGSVTGENITATPKPKTQNPKPKTQNPKPKTQNPKPKTQNPKPKTFQHSPVLQIREM